MRTIAINKDGHSPMKPRPEWVEKYKSLGHIYIADNPSAQCPRCGCTRAFWLGAVAGDEFGKKSGEDLPKLETCDEMITMNVMES
jgi:hypothetical protein